MSSPIQDKVNDGFKLWGVRLSPFSLKIEACLDFQGRHYKRLPDEGSLFENSRLMASLELAKREARVERFPVMDAQLDEYPSVPFLLVDQKRWMYDSSGIARWLDQVDNCPYQLLPAQEPFNFIVHLIDEAFDEYGLYMVHHMRWVRSARSNEMGSLLAKEFRKALPPGGPSLLKRQFPKRQVRRLPYLFSVAPKGYQSGMKASLNPPYKAGFPETHTLLNQSWKRYLKTLENLLTQQDFLLGAQFTLADASVYGQLGMNLVDREAADLMLDIAPRTFNWLQSIQHGEHIGQHQTLGAFRLNPALSPLLNTIMGTFSALMVQNETAWLKARAAGVTSFNEEAFNQGQALFTGQLMGYPFKTVIKSFQVRVWREIKAHWQALSDTDRDMLKQVIEAWELFETNRT